MHLRPLSLALTFSLLAQRALAQGILPGSQGDASASSSQFSSLVRSGVDSTARRWEAAFGTGDPKKVAELFTSDAMIVTTTGAQMQGRGAVRDMYARLLPRMQSVHVRVQRVVASGELAFATMQLSYDVPLPTGGSYPHTAIVGVALKQHWHDGWQISAQMGGDIPSLARVSGLSSGIAPGGTDTLRVRLTDASGAPVPGSLVAFDVFGGHGTLDTPHAMTDAQGVATVVFTASTEAERIVVRALAGRLPDEPVFFSARSIAEKRATPDSASGSAVPASAPHPPRP